MKVGYDIDGVLADFGAYFLEYLDIEDKSPFTQWDDVRITEHFHKLYFDYRFWLKIPKIIEPEDLPYKPSYYVTARPIPSRITAKWLEINGFPKAPVKTVGVGGSKVQYLKDKGVELFFDDAVHNYEALNNAGVNCYLVSRTHNLSYECDKRVDNLKEFSIDA